MSSAHSVGIESFHYKWSRTHKPVLNVKPGDRVTFHVNEVTSWQVTEKSDADALLKLDGEKFYPLAGPVAIEGAKPGDALLVDILKVKTAKWGWSGIIPGFGLLGEFTKPHLKIWDLKNGKYTAFNKEIRVPIRPFCGVYGVAPPEDGHFDVMPPGKHGGNMDNRHLAAGSSLLLPIWVDDALFSVGDVHAAQGDGEVCVTAIECPGEVTVRLDVIKGAKISSPRYILRKEPSRPTGFFGTTGIASDLMEATKLSVRNMLDYLTEEHGLTREEAYILCSVSADLMIHEVVDKPNWTVGTVIPLANFRPRRARRDGPRP